MLKRTVLAALVAGLLGTTSMARAAEGVVVASSGGVAAELMKNYCNTPFTKDTGIPIDIANSSDPMPELRAQMLTGNILWDITNAPADAIYAAAKNGWLEPIDWDVVDPGKTLPDIARNKYGIGINAFSEVLAVRTDKLPGGKEMTSWADFWDTKTFPGPRSLRNTPVKTMEFALLADGVPIADVYKVLGTPAGIDRAFAKLDLIKPSIVSWWSSAQAPVQLLASGDLYYAPVLNGRVAPLQQSGKPIKLVWNGAAFMTAYHAIVKGAKHPKEANQWLKFCWMDPQRQAKMTEVLHYPGFPPDMFKYLSEDVKKDLPTYPDNQKVQFAVDGLFWSEHRADVQRRWDKWRLKN